MSRESRIQKEKITLEVLKGQSFGLSALLFCLTLFLSSCLGDKGNEQAQCSAGEKFDNVSRKCINVQGAPVPLLSNLHFIQDQQPEEFILNYKDFIENSAFACQVTMHAPEKFYIRAREYHQVIDYLAALVSLYPADSHIREAWYRSRASFRNSQMISAIDYALMNSSSLSIFQENELSQYRQAIINRCSCSGTTCRAMFYPKRGESGTGGFSYRLTDFDGTSKPKMVDVFVASLPGVSPVATSGEFDFNESPTDIPATHLINLPLPYDLVDLDNTSLYSLQVLSGPTEGTLSGCALVPGIEEFQCSYTPSSANLISMASDEGHGAVASASGLGLSFTAAAPGSYGNDIVIELKRNPLSRSGHNYSGGYGTPIPGGRGEENIIFDVHPSNPYHIILWVNDRPTETYGGINYSPTRLEHVRDFLNNHPYVQRFLGVTAVTAAAQDSVVLGTVSLAGGDDNGFDFFEYRVGKNNLWSPPASVSISMRYIDNDIEGTLDHVEIEEREEKVIELSYTDFGESINDNSSAICDVTIIDLDEHRDRIVKSSPCDCDIDSEPVVCSFGLRALPFSANSNFSDRDAEFSYQIRTNRLNVDGVAVSTKETLMRSVTVEITEATPFPSLLSSFDAKVDDGSGGAMDPLASFTPIAYEYFFKDMEKLIFYQGSLPDVTLTVGNSNKGSLVGGNCFDSGENKLVNCGYLPSNGNDQSGGAFTVEQGRATIDFFGSGTDNFRVNFRGEHVNDQLGMSLHRVYSDDNAFHVVPITENDKLNIAFFIGSDIVDSHFDEFFNKNPPHYDETNIFHQFLVQNIEKIASIDPPASFTDPEWEDITYFSGGLPYFDYIEINTPDAVLPGRVTIHIQNTDNQPVICQYSSYPETSACGPKGCKMNGHPEVNNIAHSEGLVYFDDDLKVCYKSEDSQWNVKVFYIADVHALEGGKIEITNLAFDWGTVAAGTIDNTDMNSSNTSLIPSNQITEDLVLNETITLTPASGVAGKTEIELTITNNATPPLPIKATFEVEIYDVSANHQGWTNVRALGPKVWSAADNNKKTDAPFVCNYSKASCSVGGTLQDCRGSSSLSSVIAEVEYAIYHKTTDQTCYYFDPDQGVDGQWMPLETYCNISHGLEGCRDGACITETAPTGATLKNNDFYYNNNTNQCFRFNQDYTGNWQEYRATGEVTLSWNPFTIMGDGVDVGYNVYRRIAGEEFDYSRPINRDPIKSFERTYIDNAKNSFYAPVPNTVYYYEVRPLVRPTGTSIELAAFVGDAPDSEIRVMVPDDNLAFVHQWIVNLATCQYMNRDVDRTLDYACIYHGPGADQKGDHWYFDIGRDMLVDRFEAGCNFSRSPACTGTPHGDCYGIGNPNWEVDALPGSVFYDRLEGKCYYKQFPGINEWVEFNNDILSIGGNVNHREPMNPPITNITADNAQTFCEEVQDIQEEKIIGYNVDVSSFTLPDRKQQLAYSHWDRDNLTDSEINTLQTGLALNSRAKCNSSGANGLESFFTNSASVTSSNFFTLTGTLSSDIRSLITGSHQTRYCVSRFGVQDAVGNVAEWTTDQIACRIDEGGNSRGYSYCEAVGSFESLTDNTINTYNGENSVFDRFRIGRHPAHIDESDPNPRTGPCRDTNLDGWCDEAIDSMVLSEQRHQANRFLIPLGLPVNGNFVVDYPDDPIVDDLLRIGQSNGIPLSRLHNDRVTFNTDVVFSTGVHGDDATATMTTGGSFLSGQGAGRWNMEFVEDSDTANWFQKINDLAFFSNLGRVYISGNPEQPQSDTTDPVPMKKIVASNNDSSIGFRCIAPLYSTQYED